jgi:hypothetical protein
MARDIEAILKQLGLENINTYSDLITALEKNNVITDNEINNIINTSVKPLPNVVKNRPDYVKQKMYFPIVDEELGFASVFNKRIVLLKELIKQLHTNAENDKATILNDIEKLITDLNTGVLKVAKAIADEYGRNIAETYAVEDEINAYFDKILNGDVVVGRAKTDAEGNNFIDTYATKSMLDSVKKILEDDLKEGILVPLKAEQDGEGNNIADTYAKDNYVNSTFTAISNGNFVAGKAKHDKDGNDISATYAKKSVVGSPNGIASLNENGVIPSSQLPSYVDDVIEGNFINTKFYDKNNNLIEPESGKIYLNLDDNRTFRWSGSSYVEISKSVTLGETSATAYAGDKGKKNAEDIAEIKETLPTLQPKLTAGNGISISADGTISISLPNGDEVAY